AAVQIALLCRGQTRRRAAIVLLKADNRVELIAQAGRLSTAQLTAADALIDATIQRHLAFLHRPPAVAGTRTIIVATLKANLGSQRVVAAVQIVAFCRRQARSRATIAGFQRFQAAELVAQAG